MRRLLTTVLAIFSVIASSAYAAGKAEHVVVVVWDGLRPDSVTESNTPALFKLAHDGVFFQNHHSVYLSSTEVNGIAMATGAYPNRSGVLANREYRPAINPLISIAIESADSIRKGDEVSGSHYLKLPTLAEILQGAKLRTAIAGTKPVAVLQDRSHRDRIKLTDNSKPETPNTAHDTETTRALIGAQWDAGVRTFSLLWLSEPDYSEHFTGPGSRPSLRALKGSDDNLALVLKELDARGLRDKTNVFVVSDHGFSTIARCVDVAAELKKAGFNAAREFKEPPAAGDVMVVGNGGSVLLYVIDRDPRVIRQIVEFLQQQDWPGVIFTREKMSGTFTLDQARIDTTDAPDIVIALRWTNDKSDPGVAGMIISDAKTGDDTARKPSEGNHTTLSAFDMRATLAVSGPDFRRGMVDQLPSGNPDLAPTILHLLGVNPPQPQDGRMLTEAFVESPTRFPPIEMHTLEVTQEMGKTTWHQYLRVTEFSGAVYFDEGNGQSIKK